LFRSNFAFAIASYLLIKFSGRRGAMESGPHND